MKNTIKSVAVRKEVRAAISKGNTPRSVNQGLSAKLLIVAVILGAFVIGIYCSVNGQL